MLRKKNITHLFLALWLAMSFASCASDTASDVPVPNDEVPTYLEVKVTVGGSDGTRADDNNFTPNPSGGEDGDGDDRGEEYEYTVTNLNLILYASQNNDMKEDEAKIEKVIYFEHLSKVSGGSSTGVAWTSGKREVPPTLIPQNYHMLVVANAGDMTSAWQGKTLKEVRDFMVKNVCHRDLTDITKSSDFMMSSRSDAQLTAGNHSGTMDDPYVASIDIERLAARIDILPNAAAQYDKTTKTYTYNYNVYDGSKNLLGGFVMEYVMPYNDVTSGEYLIKRVTDGNDQNSVNYNSKETEDANHNSTNYVICPWTTDRTSVTYSHDKKTITDWEAMNTFSDFYRVRKADKKHGADNNNAKTKAPYNWQFFILDYVQENTSFDNSEDTATGLVFKGTYYDKDQWEVETDADKIAEGNFGYPKSGATGTPKCYTYIIRHSDPTGNGTTADPMHYGIVRNNIYRIKIDGIQGEGSDGLKLTINVRKWATYTHEEATM